MFSEVFVHNRPHGYPFTARPCYGAAGMHPTGMLSFLRDLSCWNAFLYNSYDIDL